MRYHFTQTLQRYKGETMSQKTVQIRRKEDAETFPFQTAWWKPFFSAQKEVANICKEACEDFIPAPANEFWKLQDDMLTDAQTQMHRVFGGIFNARAVSFPWMTAISEPKIDISETAKAFQVTAELPGVEREDIEIATTSSGIIIQGKKNPVNRTRDTKPLHRECFYGPFTRTIILPEEADLNHMDADFEKNILTINVTKKNLEALRGDASRTGKRQNDRSPHTRQKSEEPASG